jgi:Rieske Fe-S protein
MLARRRFQHLALLAWPLIAVGSYAAAAVRFLTPLPKKPRDRQLDVGALADFGAGKPSRTVEFNEQLVHVYYDGAKVRAVNAMCPHLGCSVRAPDGKGFLCPCHGARFTLDGVAVPGGPTPEPLVEFEIADTTGGRVVLLDALKSRAEKPA